MSPAPSSTTSTKSFQPLPNMSYDFNRVAFSLLERSRDLPLKWWRDESWVCRMLELEPDQLNDFLVRCSKGYSGVRDSKVQNCEPFNVPIDLKVQGNLLGLHHGYCGRGKSNRQFVFEYSGAVAIPYKSQQEIIQYVLGNHPNLENYPDMQLRRKEMWFEWATGIGGEMFTSSTYHTLPLRTGIVGMFLFRHQHPSAIYRPQFYAKSRMRLCCCWRHLV